MLFLQTSPVTGECPLSAPAQGECLVPQDPVCLNLEKSHDQRSTYDSLGYACLTK